MKFSVENEVYNENLYDSLKGDVYLLYNACSAQSTATISSYDNEFSIGSFTWSKYRFKNQFEVTHEGDTIIVCAILIRTFEVYGYSVSITSDDDWDSALWLEARKLYESVFNEEANYPFVM